jgi:hypothetical protein
MYCPSTASEIQNGISKGSKSFSCDISTNGIQVIWKSSAALSAHSNSATGALHPDVGLSTYPNAEYNTFVFKNLALHNKAYLMVERRGVFRVAREAGGGDKSGGGS